jgi:hypothetical protein
MWDLKACKDAGGDFDAETQKCYGKKVYSFDLGRMIEDRTKEEHPYGIYDFDFRDVTATSQSAHKWTYGGTGRTIEKTRKHATALIESQPAVECRIVNSKTGEILEKMN